MNKGNIRVQQNYKVDSPSDSRSLKSNLSPQQRQARQHISFGNPSGQVSRKYQQREGERDLNVKNGNQMLEQDDYPQLFNEDKIADHKLNSFEVYDEIYGVFGGNQRSELERIQRRYGHTERRAQDQRLRLRSTFGNGRPQGLSPLGGSTIYSQSITPETRNSAAFPGSVVSSVDKSKVKKPQSRIARELIKTFTPSAAHITSLHGGASEAGLVSKAKQRLKETIPSTIPVDAASIRKYIREVTLNDKFRGTWVAHGLTDESTQTCLARKIKQPDLVNEIIIADDRAREWLDEQDKIVNTHLNLTDPPLVNGKYYNDFCNRNLAAYSTYRAKGIGKIIKEENFRFHDKIEMQKEAIVKGITPSGMFTFNKKREKEQVWRKIIPETVLESLTKRTQNLKDNESSQETSSQMSYNPHYMGKFKGTIKIQPLETLTQRTSSSLMPVDAVNLEAQESILSGNKQSQDKNMDIQEIFTVSREDKTRPSMAQYLTESQTGSQIATVQQQTKESSTQGGRDSALSSKFAPRQLPLQSRHYGRNLQSPMHKTMQEFSSKDIMPHPMRQAKAMKRTSAFSSSLPREELKFSPRSPPRMPMNFKAAMVKAKFSSMQQMAQKSSTIGRYVEAKQRRRSPVEIKPIVKRASILEVIKLTSRLSVPKVKNNRARHIERRKRLQSLDNVPFKSKSPQRLPSLTVPTSTTMFPLNQQQLPEPVTGREQRRYHQNKTQMVSSKGLQSPFGRADRNQNMDFTMRSNYSVVSPKVEKNQMHLALDATIKTSWMQTGGLRAMQEAATQSQMSQSKNLVKEETRLSPFRHRQSAINKLEQKSAKSNRFSIHSPNRSPSLKCQDLTDTRSPNSRVKRDISPKVTNSIKSKTFAMGKQQLNQRSGSALGTQMQSHSKMLILDSRERVDLNVMNMTFQNVSHRKTISPHGAISTRSPSPIHQHNQSPTTTKSHRKSNFELNCGLHKQRSSILKEATENKLKIMMSKTKEGRAIQNITGDSETEILQRREITIDEQFELREIGQAIFENFSSQAEERLNTRNAPAASDLNQKLTTTLTIQSQDSEDDINKIPFQKKAPMVVHEVEKSKDQKMNIQVIKKCMSYLNQLKKSNALRNHEIDRSIEDYLSDQQKYFFKLLDEIEIYPPSLQKQLLNYKWDYNDEQEMQSREIIHMYRTGETDPTYLLSNLMQIALENPNEDKSDEEEDSLCVKVKKPKLPNLTCFRKKGSVDQSKAAEN